METAAVTAEKLVEKANPAGELLSITLYI